MAAAAAGLAVLGAQFTYRQVLARQGSGRSNADEAKRLWSRRLADATFDGLLIHRNGTILQINASLVRLLGYRETELLGTHFANLAHPSQKAELRTELEAPAPRIAEFTLLHADKTQRFVELASQTLEFEGLPATVTAIRDVTSFKQIEAKLKHLAHNDGLTGLANRVMLVDRLQAAVSRNDSAGGATAMLTLQLPDLRAINTGLGRNGGDALLRQIANRLLALVHENDTVARLGGDKFGIVQPHEGAANRTASLTSQIETALAEPFIIDGKAMQARITIGVAVYPEHATTAEGLMHASGFAMSQARPGGAHVFSHAEAAAAGFNQGQKKTIPHGARTLNIEEQRLAQDLRVGIPRGEIHLEYQPVFAAKLLSIAGFEACVRWRHPKDGMIAPATFIALADDAGLAGALGHFIMEAACTEAVRCKTPMMAVNLSPMQFRDPHLVARMREILLKTGLAPRLLEVQVTEEMLLHDPPAALETLHGIRALGVLVALDDFGTGFSALTKLSEFPFTRIKIDKRFIRVVGEDSSAQAIVLAILALARNLQIEVIAEGVESEAQLEFLREHGCGFVQGDHLARPGPQASARAVVTRGVSTPGVSTPGVSTPGVSTPGVSTPGVVSAFAAAQR